MSLCRMNTIMVSGIILDLIIVSTIMLIVLMLSAIIINVIMLGVVVPFTFIYISFYWKLSFFVS
jgi:hypothetical protein